MRIVYLTTIYEFIFYKSAEVDNRALQAVLEIGNSSTFEHFRAVFTEICLKMLGLNIVKMLEIAPKLLENCSKKTPC